MLTRGDIADALYERLFRDRPEGASSCPAGDTIPYGGPKVPPARKVFLSDWELRRMVKPGQKRLAVPANAIVSPLSLDWLDYNGVEIVRE
ncbi:MAG: hypothetical protein FD189_195 [Elusimicrobia bacterium]|nr:MAG: hypothetical protein FD154_347 [Elusimicrobiota bacterium]KAF0158203.1 MAG: hypothetical protein FD189_195 [Elusimicrobiota bacterium]